MANFQQAALLVDGGERIECWFNPTTLKVSRTAKWDRPNTLGGSDAPLTYLGGEEQALNLRLLFHAEPPHTGDDVQAAIDAIYDLMEPVDQEVGELVYSRPPTVRFAWGAYTSDPAVCSGIDVETELFDLDGTPLRAWVSLSLTHSFNGADEGEGEPTNPTTRATYRRRLHEVAPGEDIALVAQHHYRDPTRWRQIADANGLDDPLRLAPPAILVVPLEDL
jgi:hypothetical protein